MTAKFYVTLSKSNGTGSYVPFEAREDAERHFYAMAWEALHNSLRERLERGGDVLTVTAHGHSLGFQVL